MGKLYETDFYAWTQAQADALKRGDLSSVDMSNIIEEIETMGRGEKRELLSRLEVLIAHLLKWRHQFINRGNSWKNTISEQRHQLELVLEESPSLVPTLDDTIDRAYKRSKTLAANETGIALQHFPAQCPFSKDQIMQDGWLPDEEWPQRSPLTLESLG